MGLNQYLKDTRGELRHVAWPTRIQTIVYTFIVIAISILVSLYLGFADFLLTRGLGKIVEAVVPEQAPITQEQLPASTTPMNPALPFSAPTSTK